MDNQTKDIIEMLNSLYTMVNESRAMPMAAGKCIVEKEPVLTLIDEIRANLPQTIATANRLVEKRDEFIATAKREAEAMRKSAEDNAKKLVEEQEVVRAANAKASAIISDAENKSAALKRVTTDYVNDLMGNAAKQLGEALGQVQQLNKNFNNLMQPAEPAPLEPIKTAPAPAPEKKKSMVSRISMDDAE